MPGSVASGTPYIYIYIHIYVYTHTQNNWYVFSFLVDCLLGGLRCIEMHGQQNIKFRMRHDTEWRTKNRPVVS